eukprot:scaffold30887_cov24-Prasinocladus_malaysianus.AAC.1
MPFLSGGLTARDAILLKPHTCDDLYAARLVFLADLCVNLQAAFEVCHGLAGVVAAAGRPGVTDSTSTRTRRGTYPLRGRLKRERFQGGASQSREASPPF